ncbi:hypothetical protein HK405_004727 [Cladochytrium tenue]|nr:hypothetical protein HK405_004727 [Cladochytrium tenue]
MFAEVLRLLSGWRSLVITWPALAAPSPPPAAPFVQHPTLPFLNVLHAAVSGDEVRRPATSSPTKRPRGSPEGGGGIADWWDELAGFARESLATIRALNDPSRPFMEDFATLFSPKVAPGAKLSKLSVPTYIEHFRSPHGLDHLLPYSAADPAAGGDADGGVGGPSTATATVPPLPTPLPPRFARVRPAAERAAAAATSLVTLQLAAGRAAADVARARTRDANVDAPAATASVEAAAGEQPDETAAADTAARAAVERAVEAVRAAFARDAGSGAGATASAALGFNAVCRAICPTAPAAAVTFAFVVWGL